MVKLLHCTIRRPNLDFRYFLCTANLSIVHAIRSCSSHSCRKPLPAMNALEIQVAGSNLHVFLCLALHRRHELLPEAGQEAAKVAAPVAPVILTESDPQIRSGAGEVGCVHSICSSRNRLPPSEFLTKSMPACSSRAPVGHLDQRVEAVVVREE